MATKYHHNFKDCYPMSDTGAMMQLALNTELTWTVPGDRSVQYRAHFNYTNNASVWVAVNGTATAPTAGTIADTYNQQFRPDSIYVSGGDVLHFIDNTETAQVGVSLLQLP
jgi:hypothetical protein